MAEESDDETYCLCRRAYSDGDFMIQCDICKDWFHGGCVLIKALRITYRELCMLLATELNFHDLCSESDKVLFGSHWTQIGEENSTSELDWWQACRYRGRGDHV